MNEVIPFNETNFVSLTKQQIEKIQSRRKS